MHVARNNDIEIVHLVLFFLKFTYFNIFPFFFTLPLLVLFRSREFFIPIG